MVIMSIMATMFRYETSSASRSSLRLKAKMAWRASRRLSICMRSQNPGRQRHVGEHELSLRVLSHRVHGLDHHLVGHLGVAGEDDVMLVRILILDLAHEVGQLLPGQIGRGRIL